jgi:hypothetical protein
MASAPWAVAADAYARVTWPLRGSPRSTPTTRSAFARTLIAGGVNREEGSC